MKGFVIGKPLDTESVIFCNEIGNLSEIPDWINMNSDYTEFTIKLEDDDVVFGLGESLHGMNKRGFKYVCLNTDQPLHTEDKDSLYGSHNFLVIDSPSGKKGIFVDYPAKTVFDIGHEKRDVLKVIVEEPLYKLYVLESDSSNELVKEFRKAIGKSYKAPLWGFGYGQSRWGYRAAEDIENVVRNHRDNDLPLDSVYLDIDYMEDFKDFTVSSERFPNFADFVKKMKKENIHLIPIIDAAVKKEDGYEVYEEGTNKGYFCKDKDGKDFVTAVWPGRSLLPDFMNPAARKWFGDKYKILTDLGIDGFWNDMNEPALFYSDASLSRAAEELSHLGDELETLNLDRYWHYLDLVRDLSNNKEDYESFYHDVNGMKVRHDRIHNLYGYNMTRAAAEAFKEIAPGKEMLIFSRSSYIGMHRYAGIWTGDNCSFYSHIKLLISQLPGLNMAGFLFVGADTGGFGHHTSEELLMRFMGLSLFTPLFRNHCAIGCRDQEVYRFERINDFRNILKLRYALIPYLYKIYSDSIENDDMMFRPLAFEYPDDADARLVEDQLLIGDFMITPVYEANAKGRYVYVPEKMKLFIMRSNDDYDVSVIEKGHYYLNADINEIPIFVRGDKDISEYLTRPANSTAEL